jgi:hypothetical protein
MTEMQEGGKKEKEPLEGLLLRVAGAVKRS